MIALRIRKILSVEVGQLIRKCQHMPSQAYDRCLDNLLQNLGENSTMKH